MSMAWIYLGIAGLLEVVWSLGLKMSEGFSKPVPSAVTIVAAAASFYLLSLALRDLPVGTGYAVFVGIGAVGAAIFGIVLLGEALTLARAGGIAMIVAGVALLKFAEIA
jgi:quaternary ammonium compound-resistance protein SugE